MLSMICIFHINFPPAAENLIETLFQFFVGWWFIIDAHAKYPDEMSNAYHVCGVFGTISLFM